MSAENRKLKCDICTHGDGWNGLKMIRCNDCQISVHKECYGLETFQKSAFICWPCRAVGESIQVEAYTLDGKRMEIVQQSRPTRCELCSVSSGTHAMHPIYDDHGRRGRQLFRQNPTPRLLWAHTLCAFVLTTQGLLYGCAQDGTYDGDDTGDNDDDRSYNPGLVNTQLGEEYGESAPVHHFVYYLRPPGQPDNEWTKSIKEHQELKCCVCGQDDRKPNVLRIPLQCCANDTDEHKMFKPSHTSLLADETCVSALHIGCARWGGGNPNGVMRIYYNPKGRTRSSGIYCQLHAEEIEKYIQERARREKMQAQRNREPPSSSSSSTTKHARKPSFSASPSHSKQIRRLSHETVLPSLERVAPGKKKRPNSKTATTATLSKPRSRDNLLENHAKGMKRKKPKWHESLDRNEAVPVAKYERPLLAKNRKELASQKSIVQDSTLGRIVSDLIEKAGDRDLEPSERKALMKGRKNYWKRELSELTSDDFISMWRKAVGEMGDYLNELLAKKNTETSTSTGASSSSKPASTELPARRPSQSNTESNNVARRPSTPIGGGLVDLTEDEEPKKLAAGQPSSVSGQGSLEPSDVDAPDLSSDHENSNDNPRETQKHMETQASRKAAKSNQGTRRRIKNQFRHLALGKDFNSENEFTFDTWDEVLI